LCAGTAASRRTLLLAQPLEPRPYAPLPDETPTPRELAVGAPGQHSTPSRVFLALVDDLDAPLVPGVRASYGERDKRGANRFRHAVRQDAAGNR
jgi:hypothetical protein